MAKPTIQTLLGTMADRIAELQRIQDLIDERGENTGRCELRQQHADFLHAEAGQLLRLSGHE